MARLKSPSFVIFKYDKAQHTQSASWQNHVQNHPEEVEKI